MDRGSVWFEINFFENNFTRNIGVFHFLLFNSEVKDIDMYEKFNEWFKRRISMYL